MQSKRFSGRIRIEHNDSGDEFFTFKLYPPSKANELREILKKDPNPVVCLEVDVENEHQNH